MRYKYQHNHLPSPPFVDVEGIANFRDIGGYPILSSPDNRPIRSIRRGLIFRSGEPTRLTKAGMQKLQSMGVTTIFDLRSASEAMKDVHAIIESDGSRIERISVPIFSDDEEDEEDEGDGVRRGQTCASQAQVETSLEGADNTKMSAAYKRCAAHMHSGVDGTTAAYRSILHHAPNALRQILIHLKDNPSSPILLHCKLGRDRTGVIIALLLSLAGVSDEIIAKEYQLTEVGLGPMREDIVADVLGCEMDDGDGKKGGEKVAMMMRKKKVDCLVGAREKNMSEMLGVLRRDFAGAEAFVRQKCGLEAWDVEAVRGVMVVDVAPCHYVGGVVR